MNSTDPEMCHDCGQTTVAGLIFHDLFCYDVYVVSPPTPQNRRQQEVDMYMAKNIVKHLEQYGFKCYHGSRDISGGEFVIQALSHPITIIPTTIVPVYKDTSFAAFRNLLLRPDYLDRIVFLSFDSTKIDPPAVSKNSFSVGVNDPYLLPKLIRTIKRKGTQFPLQLRKNVFEKGSDPESTISSSASDFHRNIPFRRSDISRKSFRVKPSDIFITSEGPSTSACVKTVRSDGVVSFESISKLISPTDLLSHCHNHNENIRHCAANSLVKLIQKDIVAFTSNENLQNFEKQVRHLVEKQYSINFEKLYFWISAAIFFKIYKNNEVNLKMYMKTLTLTKCKTSHKTYDHLCQEYYRKLTVSLHAKMKTWPSKLDNNVMYIRKFEDSLSMIDHKSPDKETTPPNALIKNITNLPWDIKHIVIVAIAEKLFQKKYTESSVSYFSQIFASVGKKHWGVFLDVLERVTEYILKNYTEGALKACLQLLENVSTWNFRRWKSKYDKLSIILKHVYSKLIYHPVDTVRNEITPLIFNEGLHPFDVSQLGNSFIKVNEDLVETCIREHLLHSHPDIKLHDQVQTSSPHSLIFEAKTQEGDALVYVFKQRTLNDILQTNRTDDGYENFQEMSRVVNTCQGHDNIVALRNAPTNGILPFFVVEHGKPLLLFLHAKENSLTWLQMTEILLEITKAVHHCHLNKIVLCDITPASFIVVPKANGSFQCKLASFLYAKRYAKSTVHEEESNRASEEYIEDINFLCLQGESKEHVAAYFSAPETLINKTFSKYSEAWMLAATLYSVLLYGRRPFQELAHLDVNNFVKQMTTHHTASIPSSFPPDLWNILNTNLDFDMKKRMLTETLLMELETYKNNLGTRKQALYTVRTVCYYINPEDILRGYVDAKGCFVMEKNEEPLEGIYMDISNMFLDVVLQSNRLFETVSVRMSLDTRRNILHLSHENILKVKEIKTDCYKTTLISNAFHGHSCTLSGIDQDIGIDQLLFYLEQITFALQELHNHNIVHCDLRCAYMYVNPDEGTLKLGRFGRAVSLDGRQTFPYAIKMMPDDAEKWSAPEVRAKGMYSQASDIFNLAAVFWEAISTQKNIIDKVYPLTPFEVYEGKMEDYAETTIPDMWVVCITKLVKCMQKCWNPNPTKRPTLDVIIDTIKQIREQNKHYSFNEDTVCDELEDIGDSMSENGYETINEYSSSDFSNNYVWEKVVKELVFAQEIGNNPTSLIEVIETTTYENVGVPLKNKARNSANILL